MDATSPVDLLACVIFALYGKVDGARIIRQAYGDKFSERLSGMHFVFEPVPTARSRTKRRKAK
jgi:hypothetical protein